MDRLEDIVRFESANSAVAFRDRAYTDDEHAELLRDLVGLANAPVTGPRFLFLGVHDAGERRIVGLAPQTWSDLKHCLDSLLGGSVEPSLKVTVRALQVDGALVGMLCLTACDDPPYLLSTQAPDGLPAGSGWIRRGAQVFPLLRADLQRMFEAKLASTPSPDLAPRVGFPGDEPQSEVSLPALGLDELPSAVAAAKLRKVLEAKESARAVLGRTETQLSRLVHARVFGFDEPYESHSDDSLRIRIKRTADEYRAADEHYMFEVRAHKLELVVVNPGSSALLAAALHVTLPRLDTIGVAERLYASTDKAAIDAGYPHVKTGKHTVTIEADVGTIPAGTMIAAFRQPPRLWARPPAVGTTIPIDVTLHARELREPRRETLLVRIVPAPTPGKKPRRD
jgi:hypothetical protein